MARLNLTIPDSLYERLDRLRDRVNVSKVCAIALAKELDMLEGHTTLTANPKAQRLIERLEGIKARKDRWFQQGYEDGENWAAENAMPFEIRRVLEEFEREPEDIYALEDVEFPESFDLKAASQGWGKVIITSDHKRAKADLSALEVEEMNKVDQDAYLRGWHRAVQELWKAAEPSLRWLSDD